MGMGVETIEKCNRTCITGPYIKCAGLKLATPMLDRTARTPKSQMNK